MECDNPNCCGEEICEVCECCKAGVCTHEYLVESHPIYIREDTWSDPGEY